MFQNIKLLFAFPEYKVALPGGLRPSQNDIFVLARGNKQLVSIMVEGKVSESFVEPVSKWLKSNGGGKSRRLEFLLNELQLNKNKIGSIRYQLLHRTVSALIEAKKFNAENALMLVHSFSPNNAHFDDYCRFLNSFNLKGEKESLVGEKRIDKIDLYFAWVKGDEKYLDEKYMEKLKFIDC